MITLSFKTLFHHHIYHKYKPLSRELINNRKHLPHTASTSGIISIINDDEAGKDVGAQAKLGTVEEKVHSKDEHYMRLAIRHAQYAFREKEVPIGAVIVDDTGLVLAAGRNTVECNKDATCHAEIEVLKKASKLKNNWRLTDCTLYSTLEPCAMCFGAIQNFRIKRIVYGAKDVRLGALGSWINLTSSKHPYHQVEVTGGLLEDECSTLLKRFFVLRRNENNNQLKSKSTNVLFDESMRGDNYYSTM